MHGLYLEGCAWSKKETKLIDSAPKVLYVQLPILFITAVLIKYESPQQNDNTPRDKKVDYKTYECPCYRMKRRTDLNFIFYVQLRTV